MFLRLFTRSSYLLASSVSIFPMPYTLDFDDLRISAELVYHAIIPDANTVGAFGTSQFFRTAWQRFISELRHFSYDARNCFAGNLAQILLRGRPPLKIKGGHRA